MFAAAKKFAVVGLVASVKAVEINYQLDVNQ